MAHRRPRRDPGRQGGQSGFLLTSPNSYPDEGDKLGGLAWKAVATDSPWIHFQPMYGKTVADPEKVVAYAHAWVHSAQGKGVYLNAMVSGTGKFWLNGKAIGAFGGPGVRAKLPLGQAGTRCWCAWPPTPTRLGARGSSSGT